MRKAYEQIREILAISEKPENSSLNMTMHLAKLTEEVGELAQGVNKLNGRKRKSKDETNSQVLSNIEEEAADSIQCIMAIALNAGVSYQSLKKRLHEKNQAFAKHVLKS